MDLRHLNEAFRYETGPLENLCCHGATAEGHMRYLVSFQEALDAYVQAIEFSSSCCLS